MRKTIDITALSIAVCVLVMVLFLPSPVLSFKCYRGDGVSCAQLGRDKLSRGDYEGAEFAFIRACKARDDDGCFELASIYDGEGNAAQAGVFYAAACDKNVAVACHKLGNLYRQGRLGKRSRRGGSVLCKGLRFGLCQELSQCGRGLLQGRFRARGGSGKGDEFFQTWLRRRASGQLL